MNFLINFKFIKFYKLWLILLNKFANIKIKLKKQIKLRVY